MRALGALARGHATLALALASAFVFGCDDRETSYEAAAPAELRRPTPEPAFSEVSDALLAAKTTADENWLSYGGSYRNQRYSTLRQITRDNVAQLAPVWVYQTGIAESFQTTPVVVDNVMYFTTPESRVIALNAATGEKLWQYVPQLRPVAICCGPNNRGVAVHGTRVYVGTLDARLVALDHRTGQVVWDVDVADPREGYSITMAPLAFDGKIFVGVSGGEYGVRGFVAAFAADSGKEVWRWYTIPAPEEAPNGWWGDYKDIDPFGTALHRDIAQERNDAWRFPHAWRRGGGGVWMTPAYDPVTHTLFFGVGNPSPDLDGSVRPGDNLYTGSIVALDARAGTLKWYFQYVPHDVWDLSPGSPPFLFQSNGSTHLGHAGKTGWLYVVDAATGRPVLRSDNFVPQENLFAPPTEEGVRMLPGANGGSAWSPVAYSPRLRLAFVLGVHQPMLYSRRYAPRQPGRLWLGGSFRYIPGEEQWGTLSAIDVRTGEIRWQKRVPVPMVGAALVTASQVLFVGQGSGTFDAFDAETGELLWQFRAGAGVHGGPVTYEVDGVQYVAVAAGGNHQLDTPRGDDLFVFALRDGTTPAPAGYTESSYARGGAFRVGAVRQVPRSSLDAPGGSH